MRKIKIIVPIIAGIVFVFFYAIGGFPVVIIDKDAIERYQNSNVLFTISKDSVINPLHGMDFSTGDNELFLIFSLMDSEMGNLSAGILRRKVLVCNDNKVLQEFQNSFNIRISYRKVCIKIIQLFCCKLGYIFTCNIFS
jgi:hypothetical protein